MGKRIAALAAETDDIVVVGALEGPKNPQIGQDLGELSVGKSSGARVWPAGDIEEAVEATGCGILVDFSNAEASTRNVINGSRLGLDVVMGTTGHVKGQMEDIRSSIIENGVSAVISPNMSVGVNVMLELCASAVNMVPDYDIEIFEIHHNKKVDSPSGTALKIADRISEASESDRSILTGRSGEGRRQKGEIGISSARAGDVVGDHTVIFAGPSERIEISHRAQSRDVFVHGVLCSVRFVGDAEPGIYTITEVLKAT